MFSIFSPIISAKWFSYDVIEQKEEEEYYDRFVAKVTTYVCYTTNYGERYHAKGCQYLWNSSHQTTVYEAEQNGYKKCSKCTPTEVIIHTITKRDVRTVIKDVTVTKRPTFLVWISGISVLSVVYLIILVVLKTTAKQKFIKPTNAIFVFLLFLSFGLLTSCTNNTEYQTKYPDHSDVAEIERYESIIESYNSWLEQYEPYEPLETFSLVTIDAKMKEAMESMHESWAQETTSNPTPSTSKSTSSGTSASSTYKRYVLNTSTKVFHFRTCYSVKRMSEGNKQYHAGPRKSIIAMGYRPCENCDP